MSMIPWRALTPTFALLVATACGGVDEQVPLTPADLGDDRDMSMVPVDVDGSRPDDGVGTDDEGIPILDAEVDAASTDDGLPDEGAPDDGPPLDEGVPDDGPPMGDTCPEDMVLVDGGPFLFGFDDEPLTLLPYCIDITEVSGAAFVDCIDDGACDSYENWARCREIEEASPHQCRPDRLDYPANWIDWYRADQYCRWAGGRLPTHEEWEKAARGPRGATYPWGERVACSNAHFERGDPFDACSGVGGLPDAPVPVWSYDDVPSPYGAINLIGNVREWIDHREDREVLPSEDDIGITKGGDWRDSSEQAVGPAFNGLIGVAVSSRGHGFRCVTDPR